MSTLAVMEKTTDEVSLPRLRWQCRRGMLELDILLNTFLDNKYSLLNRQQRLVFNELLDYPDQTLLELLMGKMASGNPDIATLVEQIRRAVSTKKGQGASE